MPHGRVCAPSGDKVGGLHAREQTARCLGGACAAVVTAVVCCARLVIERLVPSSRRRSGSGSVRAGVTERGDVSATRGQARWPEACAEAGSLLQ
jgi:hypothetical protein